MDFNCINILEIFTIHLKTTVKILEIYAKIVFNHSIRFCGPQRPADQCDHSHKTPVFYPHVDNDPSGAKFKAKEILGEEEAQKY